MISSMRNRLGVPGIIAIIALVFAMTGGAIAANGGGSNATTSAKAKKGPPGPKGPKGAKGDPGPQGPAGANGKDGSNGTNGEDGAPGAAGPAGKNGTAGAVGPEGSPWTAGGTLPSGSTETGVWGLGTVSAGAIVPNNPMLVPISFSIPLAAPLSSVGCPEASESPCQVHYIRANGKEFNEFSGQEVTSTKCLGTVAAPSAVAGNLCIYSSFEESVGNVFNAFVVAPSEPNFFASGADKSGAFLTLYPTAEGARAFGAWAVTAP